MSIGRTLLETDSFISNDMIAKLTNVFAESNEIQKDKMFAEKHGINHSEYKSEDYVRVAFKKEADMHDFTQAMKKEGVEDIVTTTYRYNGQFIAEMPRQATESVSANLLIENYERTTGYKVGEAKDEYHDRGMESGEKAEQSLAREVLLKYLDGANEVMSPIMDVVYWAEMKAYQDDYSSGTNIYKHKANNDGEISMSADVGRNSERAIVLNNDTVVINGQIVTDDKIRDNILKQHEERMAYANDARNFSGSDDVWITSQNLRREHNAMQVGANQLNDTADLYGRLLAKQQNNGLSNIETNQLNEAKNKLDEYKGISGFDFDVQLQYDASKSLYTYTTKNLSTTDFKANNENILRAIENTGYPIRNRGGVFDTDMFKNINPTDYTALGLTPQMADMIIDVNANVHKLTPKQELAEKIKESVYRQEYTYEAHKANDYKELAFCQWSYGSLADITQALNEGNIALKVSNTEKMQSTFSRDEINLFHDKLNDAGISEIVLYEDTNFALKALDVKYNADIADINKRLAEIKKDKKMLKGSTNPNAVKEYAKLEREERQLNNKKVELARDKKVVEDIIKNITLNMTDKDKVMLSDSSKEILKDLSLSDTFKGLKIPVGELKMENLIAINEAFLKKGASLGYQFIKIDGTFDIKLLKSLSAKELRDKFGISTATRDMLVKINERGNWGHTGSTVGNITGQLLTKIFYSTEDETMQQINQVRLSVKYTTDIVKTIRRSSNINVDDWLRARRERARANRTNSNPAKAGKKKPKVKREGTVNPVGTGRADRYIHNQERTFRKIERNKKSIRAKFSRAYQRVQEAVAKSIFGKVASALSKALFGLLKLVAIACLLLGIIIGCVLLIIVIIYFLISSFLSINPQAIINNLLAPDTYADTVAYQLYEVLSIHEEDFLDQVTDLDDMYENRATLKYGARYEDFSTYIAREPRIIETDEGLRINPFSNYGCVTMDNHRSHMTRVDDYNGLTRYEIVTNPNAYTKITNEEIYMKSIETGHTSNIKDIICMVDVMYNMSMEENSDDGMTNILGMSPAQINWNNFCEKVKNVFKWLGNVVSGFFNPDSPPPFVYVDTVSYKTIQNYATTLFECSHQQTINLNLAFYDVKRQLIVTDGESEYNATQTKLGSAYGLCSDPETEIFKIRYDSSANKVSPYITNASGVGYNLDEGHFDVNIDMSMICGGASNTPCIYADWGSNQDTFNSIANMVNAGDIYCWTRNASQEETPIYQTFTSTTSYDDAIQQGHNWSDSYTPPSATFDLSTNMLIMDVVAYRKDESYVTDEYEVNYAVTDENGDLQYDDEGILVTDYYTVYECTYTWGYEVESQYCRDCQGHNFNYCGGHIEVYSQGVVYSATNEQIALVSANTNGTAPCVPSFVEDKEAMGYGQLMGKIDGDTLDKSDIYRASQTGSVPVPTVSIQGSYSGSRGLNLWIDGGEWSRSDDGMLGDRQYPQFTMDIFDVDTALDKGAKIFPLNHFSKFEGWTAENMEFALTKMTMDWHEAYGFDIPWELSGYSNDSPLSADDINAIVDSLRMRYGTSFTQEREDCVRLVLSWVNRGHYVEGHESHCFLSEYCNSVYGIEVCNPDGTVHHTVQRQGNCTAGTDIDFANYIYKYFGKVSHRRSSFVMNANVVSGQYWSGVLPADIVVHEGVMTQRGTYENIMAISKSGWQNAGYNSMAECFGMMMSSWEAKTVAERYVKDQTVIYLGMVNFDIVLSTGQVVKANTPILVDMQRNNVGGSITLHTRPSDSYEYLTSGSENVYYWADHLDGRVTYYPFD